MSSAPEYNEYDPVVVKANGRWGTNPPNMSAVITCVQGRFYIRVDDPNNLPNWMELNVSMEQLQTLHDATLLRELEGEQ